MLNEDVGQKFIEQTKPVLLVLLKMKAEFRKLMDNQDTPTETVLEKLDEIERQEIKVLVAWAESTRDINASMLGDIERGQCRYTKKKETYLMRMCNMAPVAVT